ncbi:MAG: hypothetical protein ABSH20_18430 [Tepidisphaeraceae bacterium]|jgi:hypothetical protein
MTPNELTKHRRECYGIDPIADNLRRVCCNRWLRIHGLPDAKRYPETQQEYSIILHRHNEALSALLVPGSEAILITTGGSSPEDPAPVQDQYLQHPMAWHWMSFLDDPNDPYPILWHLYARAVDWQWGTLDAELRQVIDDKSSNVMLIGVVQRVVYHPYDGGADIIARDERQRDSLRERFRDWLSSRPDGL